ncbi:hypothetical protein ACYFX5_05325 [Bremerella sp. T1]
MALVSPIKRTGKFPSTKQLAGYVYDYLGRHEKLRQHGIQISFSYEVTW